MAPEKDTAPPLWIRGLLVLTCTGVSFGHGSNDGQKGMGLIMLILIGILPLTFAVDLSTSPASDQGTGRDHRRPSRSRWTAIRPASPWAAIRLRPTNCRHI